MVIRLDAKPRSSATTAAAVPQQKYPAAASVQVRGSRDQVRPSDITDANPPVTMAAIQNVSTVTHSSTLSTAGSSSSSSRSIAPNDDDFVRAAISIEGSKSAIQQKPATSTTTPTVSSTTRQRFVKKAATGSKDMEPGQASSSSSLSSGSSSTKRSSWHSEQPGGVILRSVVQPAGNEDVSSAAVRASEPAYAAAFRDVRSDDGIVPVTSASTDAVSIVDSQQIPTDSSSQSLPSMDVTPTSSGTRQLMSLPSGDPRRRSTGSAPAKGLGRRAPVQGSAPGKFKLNISAGPVSPTSTSSTVSPSPPVGQNEQQELGDDEDQGFDNTRL